MTKFTHKSSKPNATALVSYLSATMVIVATVFAILLLLGYRGVSINLGFIVVHLHHVIVGGLLGVYYGLSQSLNWELYGTVEIKDGDIKYTYYYPIEIMSKKSMEITIAKGYTYTIRKNSIVFKGDITVKEPLRKLKHRKRYKINGTKSEWGDFHSSLG